MPATTPPSSSTWSLLDKYFTGPHSRYRLTQHHLQSYSDAVRYKVPAVLQDFNSGNESLVYNGLDGPGGNDRTRDGHIAGSTLDSHAHGTTNGTRLHFFVGMDVLDLHNHLAHHDTTTNIPAPQRIQVRHQVLEYTKRTDQPRRLITPNEARLNNLNYQIELTVTLTAVHHERMTYADKKRHGRDTSSFLRYCTKDWHTRFVRVRRVMQELVGTGDKAGQVGQVVQTNASELLAAAQHQGASATASATPVSSDTIDTTTLLTVDLPQWAQRAAGTQPTLANAIDYVAQRLAAEVSPYVTLFEDVVLTKLPLMLHSPFCVLRDQPQEALREMGECPYEKGGYFIIRGKEKVIISQESYLRNIIQTRVERLQAPPTHVPPSTLILYRGESKPTPSDQEEVFEAHINCSDDPRPPVMVKLQFKRLYQYARGGGGVAPYGDNGNEDDLSPQQQQHNEMRKAMNFRGLYLSLRNSKGNPVLTDFPLFLFFRAMGVTNPVSAQSNERLSDREIIECILGYDTSGTVETAVSAEPSALRASCGIPDTRRLRPGTNLWYTPRGDGDCAWVLLPKAPSGRVTGWKVGDTIRLTISPRATKTAATKTAATKTAATKTAATKTAGATVFTCVIIEQHENGSQSKVRWVSGAGGWSAWTAAVPFHGRPIRVHVQPTVATHAMVVPCRYERRHKATVRRVKLGSAGSAGSITLAYHTHTAQNRTYDPILYDLLLPSIAEGSFAPTVELARELLDKQIDRAALLDQDRSAGDSGRDASSDRQALFRMLFTHLAEDPTFVVPTSATSASSGKSASSASSANAQAVYAAEAASLRQKQFYLGYMTKRLMFAYMGMDERETSRDSYRLRRVQTSGEMLVEVFRYEYFQLGNKYKTYVANGMRQQGTNASFRTILAQSVVRTNLFDAKYMTERLQKSFMGNWGSKVAEDADQKAYCQELIRLSYYGSIAYLRRVHKELPSTSKPGQKKGTSKAVGPRLLHASQYGMICPLETPDGGNIGKIKHLSTFAFVCPELPSADRHTLLRYLYQFTTPLSQVDSFYALERYHKVIVDGNWAFVCPVGSFVATTRNRRTTTTTTTTKTPLQTIDPKTGTLTHPLTLLTPDELVRTLRLLRRNGLISPLISVAWNISRREILVSTQEGRVIRPLLIVDNGLLRFSDGYHNDPRMKWSWAELLSGRNAKQTTDPQREYFHDLSHRYDAKDGSGWLAKVPGVASQPMQETLQELDRLGGVMEYLDTVEIDTRMLAMDASELVQREAFFGARKSHKSSAHIGHYHPTRHTSVTAYLRTDTPKYRRLRHRLLDEAIRQAPPLTATTATIKQRYHHTHCELHPSLMLGVMAMLIPFPEHSPAPRNQYSCHQSKQALGLFVSNFRKRMDHANHILHYPERPLAGSRFGRYINQERLNYGTNVIVAVMCYSGFNIEDALIINKRSVDRGLFQSTYYFTEEVTEKDSPNEKIYIGRNPELTRNTANYDYSRVDAHPQQVGVLPDTYLDAELAKDEVLIEAYEDKREPGSDSRAFTDYKRVTSKDGAYVDQIYLSDNARGRRVAKVTMRKVRIPSIGDKFASRSGQKGTLGALLEEEDMPFITGLDNTKNERNARFLQGLRPDIILNVHAFPTRMTLGQMLESLSCVLGCRIGQVVDSTPLCSNRAHGATTNPGASLTRLMYKFGMDSHGNQLLCNGITGEQMHSRVFVGPTYYQRLKQMPEDKYYHRRQGREDMTTRQPIGGRAHGGALKLGEMERDSLLAHGIAGFMKEGWNEKSDGFQYRIGTQSGDVEPPTTQDKVDPDRYVAVRSGIDFLNDDDEGGFRRYLRHDTEDPAHYMAHSEIVDRERHATNVETSKVNVPFAMRLLSQECEAMGVGMHLRVGEGGGIRRLGDGGVFFK